MDNKINISFIISIALAVMFLLGTPLLGPVKVHAMSIPVTKVPSGICENSEFEISSTDSFFYFFSSSGGYNNLTCCAYAINKNPNWVVLRGGSDFSFASNSRSYTKSYDGTVYGIYYRYFTVSYGSEDPFICSGTQVFNQTDLTTIINHFVFGEGSLDFQLPPQDIADSDLDIHGLDCVVLNNQQASVQVGESLKNQWDIFVAGVYSALFDSPKDYISKGLEVSGTQYIKNYVPGVSLLWDSPPVVMQSEALTVENPVQYTVWIDGKTDIKYNSSIDAIKNFFNGTSVGSCAYTKLQLHDGMIVSTPYHTYYYNTNQGLSTILDYISNNTQFTRPTETDDYQNICATTTISRIYIQAHQTDSETGDNRYGAITYVDLSNGIPTVYEGVTEDNIDDIPASDPDDGTTTDVSQPFTVSGNDLVYDDPVRQANLGETGGGGFIVPVDGFLSAGLALIQAILELIKMWFLLKLVPILTLGFTGHV